MTVRMRSATIFLLGLMALSFVAACGESSSGATGMPKATFIAKGDKICERGNEEIHSKYLVWQRHHKGEGEHLTEAERRAVAKKIVLPSIVKRTEALDQLGEKLTDRGELDGIIKAFEKATDVGAKQPAVLLAIYEGLLEVVQTKTKHFGFKVCGQLY